MDTNCSINFICISFIVGEKHMVGKWDHLHTVAFLRSNIVYQEMMEYSFLCKV